jgi:hypothetical protein
MRQRKERLEKINWPDPRDDPDEEPTEPWARIIDRNKEDETEKPGAGE